MKPTFLCPECGASEWQFNLIQIGFLRPSGVSVIDGWEIDRTSGLVCRACGSVQNDAAAWREIEESFQEDSD